jgi:hypothetical protein
MPRKMRSDRRFEPSFSSEDYLHACEQLAQAQANVSEWVAEVETAAKCLSQASANTPNLWRSLLSSDASRQTVTLAMLAVWHRHIHVASLRMREAQAALTACLAAVPNDLDWQPEQVILFQTSLAAAQEALTAAINAVPELP